jgi:Glycosyl transferase family 2
MFADFYISEWVVPAMSSVWKAAGRNSRVAYLAEGASSASDFQTVLLPKPGMAVGGAASAQPSVAIGVCTAFRPKMLESCLDAIGAQVAPAGVRIHVLVADNEPEPGNEQVVRRFGARCPFSVHYIHERRRGIPHARNAVLAKCRTLGVDWIAFTDDDCHVSPDWLASLLGAAARHQASVICGRREMVLSDPPPYWTSRPRTLAQRVRSCPTRPPTTCCSRQP